MDITDSHTHLDFESFNDDQVACIERARAAGVTRMLTIGTGGGLTGAPQAIALAEKYPFIWASAGVHPHDADHEIDMVLFERLAQHPKVVAIGETGLDFFRDWAKVPNQHKMFEAQIDLAKRVKKPLIIHSREAGKECLSALQSNGARDVGGVFHCFAEDAEFAKKLWDIGFYVSFPGILTFKKNEAIRDICKAIPLEQILIETDAPFLAPEPYRGKRCEPAFVVETAKCLATIKGLSLGEVAAITTKNTLTLFSHMR
jgi:TatD DNase family protein